MTYLDNAATTFYKPRAVYQAAMRAMTTMSSPGRGGYAEAMRAAETAWRCREAAAALFHVPDPERIIFTMNATHGLNIAIKTLAGQGDEVLISGYEHNAVLRPLEALGTRIRIASSELFEPEMAVCAFERMLTGRTKLVVMNHMSNVFGYILPIERIAALCRERGIPWILDASQSAGALKIDAGKLGAAFIAMPGHKGLYGPQGTGLLICGHPANTLLEGGTGSDSASPHMPGYLPDRLEAGTHNMPGIAGLLAGINYVRGRGETNILHREQALMAALTDGLSGVHGIRQYASGHQFCQGGVLSFRISGMDCEEVARALSERGIAVRAGMHCAPLAHRTAGTFETGTVRASFSDFTTGRDIRRFLNAVEEISRKRQK